MKDLAHQGVSGVVITRGDSAHLPVFPQPSSNILIHINCHDYITAVEGGCEEKPTPSSFAILGLKNHPWIQKHEPSADTAVNGSLTEGSDVVQVTTTNQINNNNNNNNNKSSSPNSSPSCPVKSHQPSSQNSVLGPDQSSSWSPDPDPFSSSKMTHSPGGHRLFGTTDSPDQSSPVFRMASSTAHQAGNASRPLESNVDCGNYSMTTQINPGGDGQRNIPSLAWGHGADRNERTSADHPATISHLAPPYSRCEELQEFHGTPHLMNASALRPRHYSGGEIAIEMQRKHEQQQQQQQLYQQTLQVQGQHGSAPLFYGSAPFLSSSSSADQLPQQADCEMIYSSKHGIHTATSWTTASSHGQPHGQLSYGFGLDPRYRNPSDPQLSMSISQEDSTAKHVSSYPTHNMPLSGGASPRGVPSDLSSLGSKPPHHAVIGSLPEIHMTEMLSDSEQGVPWMSNTPDNLSPTVQIVHKLAQATVSDNKGQDSPLTTSSGNNSPRTSKSSKLQIPTPDVSPSLSPTSCTKQKQRFIFPDVSSASSAKLPSAPTLESAGLNVSLATIKSDSHRWRHVSSGSSGDSSTAGEPNFAPPSSSASSTQPAVTMSSSSSGSVGTGSVSGRPVSRHRFCSGDTDIDDTLVDSETGSSVLEDSGSSREQSPFSAGGQEHATSSMSSPTPRMRSPSGRRCLQRQTVVVAAEEDADNLASQSGEEGKGAQIDDERLQPPKFKRRLHERYVSSLRDDTPQIAGDESSGSTSGVFSSFESGVETKPVLKLEAVELDSDFNESSLPKSPRRSVSDDIPRTDSYELSADEGDVFMEPVGMSPRLKPRNQQKPLDLSRSTQPTPTFTSAVHRAATGPLSESEASTGSPSMKSHYSPLFRSPHRLNYSPHALMSPQSQSPLCSVPEGGRIFNFNMQPPFEGSAGTHSDTDIISPSPMSPRFFTFPSVVPSHSASQLLNPMSEVNRLAVSPRALYPTSPIQFSLKSKTMPQVKWENFSKRSFSDSDVAYQCPICGQVFPSNDNLAKHMAKHLPTETIRSSDNNKIHYCKVCDRSFSRSDMLTRHMRLHTGLKPYECLDCGQVFSRSDHLNTHKRTHTGEKPYRCPHCPYAACRRDMITRHMRTHTKRTPKRSRYLSVPDNMSSTEGQTGSVSSSETSESHEPGRGRACSSLSSIESLDLEMGPSSQGPRWLAQASVESLPQTEDSGVPTHASTSSHDSEDTEELSPALWPHKVEPSPLCYQEGGVAGGGGLPGHQAIDDDAFFSAEPVHQERRPREPSPHPRGHFFTRPPGPPPLVQTKAVNSSSPRSVAAGMADTPRLPFSSSSSSSVSRDSTS